MVHHTGEGNRISEEEVDHDTTTISTLKMNTEADEEYGEVVSDL